MRGSLHHYALIALAGLGACAGPEPGPDPARQAIRVSMILRGVPPSAAEIDRVRADPDALEALATAWTEQEAFVDTVVDWHAEVLALRHDTQPMLPPRGPLEGFELGRIGDSVARAPLELIADRVRRGRPYPEIFASRDVATDPVTAAVWGLPYDPAGPEWQIGQWQDGRAPAGLLVDSNLWSRHISSDTNHHRARANLVHTAWLCEDLSARTLDLGPLDLTDAAAVTDAVRTDPGCASCHATLDPLAASFGEFRRYILPNEVRDAYDAGCPDPDFCYPLRLRAPEAVLTPAQLGLPEAALTGHPLPDLAALGQTLVADPRFAPCVARRWASYAGQEPLEAVPDDEVARLAGVFVDSGYDLRALAVQTALSDRFAVGGEVGPLFARPEQVARTIEDRTGFRWRADPDEGSCPDWGCWGTVDLGRNARWGFREIAGGMDGYDSLHPVHAPQPLRHLAVSRMAEEAAGFAVATEAGQAPDERRLLRRIRLDQTEPALVRAQIAELHRELLGQSPTPPELASTVGLWDAVHAGSGSTERAWAAVIAALLQAPDLAVY